MKISIIGTGYVGLVQGAVFADVNHKVVCVDKLVDKIKALQDFCERKSDALPLQEPGLPELIRENYDKGRLRFSANLEDAVRNTSVIFIAVGTPEGKDGSADLSQVYEVARQIGKSMNYESEVPIYKVVAIKSTVPIGTHKEVERIIASETKNEFDVVSNPEFLAEGRAVKDCLRPSRIVIGTSNARAAAIMEQLYEPFKEREVPLMFMSNVDAEIVKYASNFYLALQIVGTNILANLTRKAGGDWTKINQAVKKDIRIGRFVYSGLGFGGSCFPKDVRALAHMLKEFSACETDSGLVEYVLKQNNAQKSILTQRIFEYFRCVEGKRFAIWGLTFKPETNDIREAASLRIIEDLLKNGAYVSAYDPSGYKNTMEELQHRDDLKPYIEKLKFFDEMYAPLKDADAVIITVEWNDFRNPDFDMIKRYLKQPVIFDGKDILNPKQMEQLGFDYFSIGRPDIFGYSKKA